MIFFFTVNKQDYSDADCLIVTVMTHGMITGYLYAKDHMYSNEQLWNAFTADKCPTLAGKPKLFFIQVMSLLKFLLKLE